MFSVLVANVKGGCGKTTVATNLAAAFASAGRRTSLADVDRQRSSLGWVARRPKALPAITAIDWVKEIGDAPDGTDRLVIDSPAAMKVKQVEKLVRLADAIVIPVHPGTFDQLSTERFLSKLNDLKAIAKHRMPVAVVGNRVRVNTRAAARLDAYLGGLGHTVVTRLRDTQLYADVAETGLSLFDLSSQRAAEYRDEWASLLAYLETAMSSATHVAK
jgi:chromosome partitioning protein